MTATMTMAPSTALGSSSISATRGMAARTNAPVIAPAHGLVAPARRFSELRENEPPTGNAPEKPDARFRDTLADHLLVRIPRQPFLGRKGPSDRRGLGEAHQGDGDGGDDQVADVAPREVEAELDESDVEGADDGAVEVGRHAQQHGGDDRDEHAGEEGCGCGGPGG